MILLLLAGIVALLLGRISITRKLRLEGKYARLYGLSLIILSLPISFVLGIVLVLLFGPSIAEQGAANTIINLVCVVAIAIGLAIPFRMAQGDPQQDLASDKSGCVILAALVMLFMLIAAGAIWYLNKTVNEHSPALQEMNRKKREMEEQTQAAPTATPFMIDTPAQSTEGRG